MPSKKLTRLRSHAYIRQSGRCCYCGVSMWVEDARRFAEAHGITVAQARSLQCTAEHLLARQEGGPDSAANIAAACKLCNMRRHRGAQPAPTPDQYRDQIKNRMAKRRWHDQWVFTTRTLVDARMASGAQKMHERHA